MNHTMNLPINIQNLIQSILDYSTGSTKLFYVTEPFDPTKDPVLMDKYEADPQNLKRTFDWVILAPGFNLKGIPNFSFAEFALDRLNPKGRAAIPMPLGALIMRGKEAKIREKVLESGNVEGIILLPERIFEETGIQSFLLILNKDKESLIERTTKRYRGMVYIIDARNIRTESVLAKYPQLALAKESVEKIITNFKNKVISKPLCFYVEASSEAVQEILKK